MNPDWQTICVRLLSSPLFVTGLLIVLIYPFVFALELKLRKVLNPKFDPVLLDKIWWRLLVYDTFWPSCLRAGYYACCVANPKMLKGIALPAGYNMAQQVNKETYRMCKVYLWLFRLLALLSLIAMVLAFV